MISWRAYLAMLAEDGVHFNERDTGLMDDDGQPVMVQFLTRHLADGTILSYTIPVIVDKDDRVLWYMNRQIANQLRLPVEKYIHPRRRFVE